jgi:hypothetical protein
MATVDDDLRALLLGPPLLSGEAGADAVCEALDRQIDRPRALVQRVYPVDAVDMAVATRELQYLRDLPIDGANELHCKRALLLVALHMEPEFAQRFAAGAGGAMASDLCDRVLPAILPMYFRDMCQRPDVFVRMATVLHTMWAGEDLRHLSVAPTEPDAERGAGKARAR